MRTGKERGEEGRGAEQSRGVQREANPKSGYTFNTLYADDIAFVPYFASSSSAGICSSSAVSVIARLRRMWRLNLCPSDEPGVGGLESALSFSLTRAWSRLPSVSSRSLKITVTPSTNPVNVFSYLLKRKRVKGNQTHSFQEVSHYMFYFALTPTSKQYSKFHSTFFFCPRNVLKGLSGSIE